MRNIGANLSGSYILRIMLKRTPKQCSSSDVKSDGQFVTKMNVRRGCPE